MAAYEGQNPLWSPAMYSDSADPSDPRLCTLPLDPRLWSPCPACGSQPQGPASEHSIPDHEYGLPGFTRYADCRACGSTSQRPMPDEAQLLRAYPPGYHSQTRGGLLRRVRHELRLRHLLAHLGPGGAILDYGCGDGEFLRHAAAALPQRRLIGFELAARDHVEAVRDNLLLVQGEPRFLLQHLPPLGLITLNHVIEHLPQPLAVLRSLQQRLLPGGILMGQTPAADSLERRGFATRWSGYHAPRHTVVFSRAGLRALLTQAGLRVHQIQGAFNPAALAVSLAAFFHGAQGGVVRRSGLLWLLLLALATLLAPLDLLCGAPGVIDFCAERPVEPV